MAPVSHPATRKQLSEMLLKLIQICAPEELTKDRYTAHRKLGPTMLVGGEEVPLPAYSTIQRRFGSWGAAKIQARLLVQRQRTDR